MWIVESILIITIVLIWGYTMAAIDNLNQAVNDLRTTIDNMVVPSNNDAAIQTATDNIVAANDALKAKLGQ